MPSAGFPVTALVLLTLSLAAGPASAEIYRWVDDSGREHFTSDPSRVPPQHRQGSEFRPSGQTLQRVEPLDARKLEQQRRERRARVRRAADSAVRAEQRHRSATPERPRVRRTSRGLDLDKEPSRMQKYRYSCPSSSAGGRRCKRIQTQAYREWKSLQPAADDD